MSRTLPVLVNARPFGRYSMVDIDAKGGLPVIVRELLAAGLLDGNCMTCTGETLAEQVARLDPPAPDGDVIHPLSAPFKPTGGLRLLRGNLAPGGGAVIKLAGVEGGMEDGRFAGRARVFDSEQALIEALATTPERFAGPRHGGDPLRGTARRSGDAGDARSHLADHRAVPATRHHHRADDRRPLLGRVGGAGHRPRLARGGAGRPDRAYRGRRHDRRGREPGHPRLHRARGRGDSSRRAGRGGRPRRTATAGPTRWSGRPTPGCSGGCAPARCPRSRAPGCRTLCLRIPGPADDTRFTS